MGLLEERLQGKSLADYTNTQLRLALGAVLYTNTADMWKQYLNQLGYSGDVSQMLQKYYVDYNIPAVFRNYVNAGAGIFSPQQLFQDGSIGVLYDNNDFVDPATWRRNLLTYSEQFDNAAWSKTRTTVSANSAIAPDGTLTADKLVEDTATGFHFALQQATTAVGTIYTNSIYLKAAERSKVRLDIVNSAGTVNFTINADLAAGTFTTASGGSPTSTSATMTADGDGWYRVSVGMDAPTTATQLLLYMRNDAGIVSYTGDGTSGVHIWGAQLEQGSTATAYQRITDFNSDFLSAYPNTTMFLDAAGTTPATVNGLVGLQLDKSQGLVLGSELVPTGDMSNISAWTVGGAGTTIAVVGGELEVTGAGGSFPSGRTPSFTTVVGDWYTVSATARRGTTASSVSIGSGAYSSALNATTSNQTLTFMFQAVGTTSFVACLINSGTGTGTAYFDNVTVKRLAGNHRYQSTTGSKPVLRGTPVGSSLVTNGDFASGTGWTLGTGITISAGKLNFATADATPAAENVAQVVSGKVYKATFTISGFSAGGVSLANGVSSASVGGVYSANGTYEQYFTATQGGSIFIRPRTGATTLSVDDFTLFDVSAGSVTAPYGLQYDGVDDFLQTASVDFATATSDGLARRNLLAFPSAFDDGIWSKGAGVTVTPNTTLAPDGTTSADNIQFTSGGAVEFVRQAPTMNIGTTYTVSVYARLISGTPTFAFDIGNGPTPGSGQLSVTSTWQRFSHTFSFNGTNSWIDLESSAGGTIAFWGAQVEVGSTASSFQNIGTDKMFVCAGVRKLSDAAVGVLSELSTTTSTNNGVFNMVAPLTAGAAHFAYQSKGTAQSPAISLSNHAAPVTRVVTGISDIAADQAIVRINGVQESSAATDQGTGNYGNYPLYFGRRAGTSLPFNGLDFGFVIKGGTTTSAQIASTERWMAQRTGVSI